MLAWARHGIYRGVAALGLGEGDELLVPAWHHGSEVEALLRAGVGCRFYDCGEAIDPDPSELERLLSPRVRGVYLVHPLGLPADAAYWRRWCDDRSLFLVEDAAQAWLAASDGRPVGSYGDFAVFCLYKTYGLSEGAAFVASRSPTPAVDLDPRLGLRELTVRHAMWAASRSALLAACGASLRRPRPYDAALDFALRDPSTGPWRHTPFLLRRIADPAAAERRREGYTWLLDRLGEHVPTAFAHASAGASPFVFPVRAVRKRRALERLRGIGVGAVDFWKVPHPTLAVAEHPAAHARRSSLIGLPVHQELRRRDLERVAAAASAAL